jgi:hypothetical protein
MEGKKNEATWVH